MVAAAVALPFVLIGVIVWKRGRSESTKKLGAAIASIAVFFASVSALLDWLPRFLR